MTVGMLSYPDLLQTYQPRPISSEAQYDFTVAQMNDLLDDELTPDEQDLLTLLGTVIAAYEAEHYPNELFDLRGVALIKFLMAEGGLKQKDLLPIFKTGTFAYPPKKVYSTGNYHGTEVHTMDSPSQYSLSKHHLSRVHAQTLWLR